jgi:excisionase family DNA binding protein
MSAATLSKTQPLPEDTSFAAAGDDVPLTVRQAATYLGVSAQTVYRWVERKQIPHLRVMGRDIRFLKSDLAPLPRNIQTGVEAWQDRVNTMAPYIRARMARPYGWPIETGTEGVSGNQRTRKTGRRPSGKSGELFQAVPSARKDAPCEPACGSAPQTGVRPGFAPGPRRR